MKQNLKSLSKVSHLGLSDSEKTISGGLKIFGGKKISRKTKKLYCSTALVL